MNKLVVILGLSIFLFASCKSNQKNEQTIASTIHLNTVSSEGLKLMRQYCYACHSVTSISHNEIIAPPMQAVKHRYLRVFPEKDEFIDALTQWVINPTSETALMKGAVSKFNVMPKLEIDKDDIFIIANYMYDNSLEKPSWFQNHFNSQHQNTRKGQGRSYGMYF